MCGPKCTCFIFLISVWGVCFLTIVGGLFYNHSVGLLEDLPEEGRHVAKLYNDDSKWPERVKKIDELYEQNAYNAWIAAAIHLGIAVVCAFRFCCLRLR
ncbi:hypothetical protein QR680_003206 [Steinernema hermaphroditum]|uniref:Uncharacterized protein n=1 Tax=Steinernema hermaphroditum TaxID=289476 RepID=A0AA39LJR4_9BILA|nr:hypothetical protein QR680_003206 [Steinernema hermaphroditum]